MCHTPWKKDIWKADYPEWQHRKLRGSTSPTHGRARLVIALIASTNCYSELSQHHYLQMEIWVWKHRFDMISWHVSAIEATFRLFPRQHKSLCSSYFIRNHGRNCCSHSTCKQILNPLTGPSKLWTSQQTSVKSGNYSKGQSFGRVLSYVLLSSYATCLAEAQNCFSVLALSILNSYSEDWLNEDYSLEVFFNAY